MEEFLDGLKSFDPGVPDPSEIICVTSPPNKGVPHSEETKRLIVEASNGRVMPDSARKKLSEFQKNRERTEKEKQSISESQIGEKNSFYGKKHTKETRNKMSESQSKVNRSGKNNPMTKHTPEAKEKMRLAWERRRAIIREKASTSK